MRASQYGVSADLRCANSNNIRPDWRHRGVTDPWEENPKFHDPSMQDRMARDDRCGPRLPQRPQSETDPSYMARWDQTRASIADYNNPAVGGDDTPTPTPAAAPVESFASGTGCANDMLSEVFNPNMMILILFAVIIYLILGCQATIKKLKKELKQIKNERVMTQPPMNSAVV